MAETQDADVAGKKYPKLVGSCNSSDDSGSSTNDAERLRSLFLTCDADGDGFLDEADFVYMCEQLNMEDSAQEILSELGMSTHCQISYSDLLKFRLRVMKDAAKYNTNTDDVESDTSGVQIHPTQNLTSWPTMSSGSLGANSGKAESTDYDSGVRDLCSPEPTNLSTLMECHDPAIVKHMTESCVEARDFLELANRLHLAASTSLKGEIIDLSNQLQHVIMERDLLEKQLSKMQCEKLQYEHYCNDKVDETTARYDERVIELHSVIAELRKKAERHMMNIIREEDECDVSDTDANCSLSANGDVTNEISAEFNKVVSEVERCGANCVQDVATTVLPSLAESDKFVNMSNEVNEKNLALLSACSIWPPTSDVDLLHAENKSLKDHVSKLESSMKTLHMHIRTIQDERDTLKTKSKEVQSRLQSKETSSSPITSRTSTPIKSQMAPSSMRGSGVVDQFPVAKVAELKRLKMCHSDGHLLGPDISAACLPNTKVAEHLVQNVQDCSNMQEIVNSIYKCGSQIGDDKVKEFETEFERLHSKIIHLKSQKDLLSLTLEESKSYAERLTVLMGKYESNNIALSLALNYCDQVIEAYDVLSVLSATEIGVLLANCRAAGLGRFTRDVDLTEEQEEISQVLKQTNESRITAANVAQHFLHKMDRNSNQMTTGSLREEVVPVIHSDTMHGEFSKPDEQRLREYIEVLKADRLAVQITMLELESVYQDVPIDNMPSLGEGRRLDLENAVLLQELMAMKEEKAEVKALNYLLEKEQRAMELRLVGKDWQEQALRLQIDHINCELSDVKRTQESEGDNLTQSEPTDATRKENKLKCRIHDLVSTLEKISVNSDVRHRQSAEFINDLKRANSALISAFDKAKKKYQSKLKKLEYQLQSATESHETQIKIYKQRLGMAECVPTGILRPPANETSL